MRRSRSRWPRPRRGPVAGGAWPGREVRPLFPPSPREAFFRPARPGRDLVGARRSHPGGGAGAPSTGRAALCPRRPNPEPGSPCQPPPAAAARAVLLTPAQGGVWPLSQTPPRARYPRGVMGILHSLRRARAHRVERAATALRSKGLRSRRRESSGVHQRMSSMSDECQGEDKTGKEHELRS